MWACHCSVRRPPYHSRVPLPSPCWTLCTGTALSSRRTSCSAAPEPTRLPPVLGASHVFPYPLSTDPGAAPLPSEALATHTLWSSSTAPTLLSSPLFFLMSASRPYITVLICFDVSTHQNVNPLRQEIVCVLVTVVPCYLEQNMCSVNIYGLNGHISVQSWLQNLIYS